MRIDLNCDLGEGYGPWTMGDDAQILDCVTSANIACGGHAGDPQTMFRTLRLAADRGVKVGAHPGYADREGFGRLLGRGYPNLPVGQARDRGLPAASSADDTAVLLIQPADKAFQLGHEAFVAARHLADRGRPR